LLEVKLYEISLVTLPANVEAGVTRVKEVETGAMKTKEAIPYKRTELADENEPWDAAAEMAKAETPEDWRAMCALVVGDPELKTSYKLPHHKGDEGHACVWNGVRAAAAALSGARGGVEGEGQEGARAHIAKHYEDFDKGAPPWSEKFDLIDLAHYEREEWEAIVALQRKLRGNGDNGSKPPQRKGALDSAELDRKRVQLMKKLLEVMQ
ncbi:MAG: hypothetical protein K6T39_11645, partial [Anoxybacillus ayderensis]|nr:hypothetical protein [Anoxybacillus ayderensis]